MQVTLEYATQHLEELAAAADNGMTVEIARFQKPALQLVVSTRSPQSSSGGPRVLGALRGQVAVPSEEEWRAMDQELTRVMTNGSIFPPE